MAQFIEGLGLSQTPPVVGFNVVERSELAVQALSELSLVRDRGAAGEHVTRLMQTLHDTVAEQHPDAEVEPYIGLQLSHTLGIKSLISRFYGHSTPAENKCTSLWDLYTLDELNARSVHGFTSTKAAHGRSDKGRISGQARAMLRASDCEWYVEPGLQLTSMSYRQQRQVLTESGHTVMNPADYIVLNAQRRVAGKPLMDAEDTVTCFPQLPMKRPEVQDVIAFKGRLMLKETYGRPAPNTGVRRTVGQEA